jgi:putative addiction module antidote
MVVLKVTAVGNSVGVILPKELLERLGIKKGDNLYAIETKRGVVLTPYNPEFAEQVGAAEHVMREDRDSLRELAGVVEDARRARTLNQTLSHEEVKRRLKKRTTGSPRRARRTGK